MKEIWNKYSKQIIIGGLLFALLFISTCANNNSTKAEGEKEELSKELSTLKDSIVKTENERVAEKDSLTKDNKKRQTIIDSLAKNVEKSQQKIADLKVTLEKNSSKIKIFSTNEVAKALNERYNTNTTLSTSTAIVATLDTGKKVVTELYEKDACQEISVEKDQQLQDKDKVITETLGQLNNTKVELNSAEKELGIFKEYQDKAEQTFKVDDKIIRSLKVGNTVKWVAIPVALLGGYLLHR